MNLYILRWTKVIDQSWFSDSFTLIVKEPILTVVCILVRMKSFPRFWRNHPQCRNKWYLIWKPSWFSLGWNKKNQKTKIKTYFKGKLDIGGKWHLFWIVGYYWVFHIFWAWLSYEVSFISALWMVSSESWKRLHSN